MFFVDYLIVVLMTVTIQIYGCILGMNPTITISGAVVLAVVLLPAMTLLVVYRKKLPVCRKGGLFFKINVLTSREILL